MKKLIAAILCLTLCLGGVALAAVEGPIFEASSIYTLTYNGEQDVLKYTNYKNGYGMVSVEGEKLSEDKFGALNECGHGYFEAINENGLDTHGLVDSTGAELIPFNYSAFQAYSDQWVGAVIVAPTDDEKGDYGAGFFGGGDQYNIDHVDMWYLPEQKLAGTLSREQFSQGRAVGGGEYLLVEDREGKLTMYNAAFEAVDHLFEDYDDTEIDIVQPSKLEAAKLVSRVTGEAVSEDLPDGVNDVYRAEGYLTLRKRVDDENRCALIRSDGEMLTDYVLGTVDRIIRDRYVISCVYDREKSATLYGVYDLEQGAQIIPFGYDQFFYAGNLTGLNGYFPVKLDGKVGFVNVEGAVTCPIEYANDNVDKQLGCSFIYKEGGRLTLVAGDGVVTDLTALGVEDTCYGQDGSDGQYIGVKNADGKYGIMDWHGNTIVDFVMNGMPYIYRDGYMSFDGGIYHIAP